LKDKKASNRSSAYRYYLEKTYPHASFEPGCIVGDNCHFGEGVHIGPRTTIVESSIGKFTYTGPESYFHQVTIGNFCSLGAQILAGLGRHPISYVSTYPAFYANKHPGALASIAESQIFREHLPINIGSDVWIGARAIVLDGVSVAHGAIIAAGAIVTRDVEPYSVVCGVPARVLKRRFDDLTIAELLRIAWWERPLEWIRENREYFIDIDKFILKFGQHP